MGLGSDRLTVRARVGTVSYRFQSASGRLAVLALGVAMVACVAVVTLWDLMPSGISVIPLILFLNVARRQDRTLTDPVLIQAAMRAAMAEGHETKPHHWRVEGPAARAIESDLRRLNDWWTPARTAATAEGRAARVQELRARSHGAIAGYLDAPAEVILPEPDHVVSESFEAGQPWPGLPIATAANPWPVLPEPPGRPH